MNLYFHLNKNSTFTIFLKTSKLLCQSNVYLHKEVSNDEGVLVSTMRRRPKEDYQQIIHDYAKEGLKFIQIFAPSINGYGAAAYFEMIFERDA